MAAIENLATATPAEIDTNLYLLRSAEFKATDLSISLMMAMRQIAEDKGHYAGRSSRKVPAMEWAEVLETLIQMAHREVRPSSDALSVLKRWTKVQTALKVIQEEAKPLQEEFSRRGGWDRAFLVQGNGGHVHSSMNCSTCHNGEHRTNFVWMTEYSGKTEEQIVDAAGERACTVCYPTAPVETLAKPSKMFGPEELAKKAAVEERALKAAEKAQKTVEKAITDVDGSPLRERATGGFVIKTLASARMRLTDCIEFQKNPGWSDQSADIQHLARAIAAKESKTVEAVIAEGEKRAARRK